MSKTKIEDVIVPEIFAPYAIQLSKELSRLVQSGIAVQNDLLDDLVQQGGKYINLPYWKSLTGDDEVLSDSSPLTPAKITASQDVAALLIRGKSWSANELAGALAGSDPMEAIARLVVTWKLQKEQNVLFSILTGIAGVLTNHVNDISGESGEAAVINAKSILNTKQLLGDAADQLAAIAMHSATYTKLQEDNLIEYIPNSRGEVIFPSYMGYRIIIDDGCPVENGVYTTYLFASGCFARGEGVPVSLTPVETTRDSLASDDILINRWAYCLHPLGVKFNGSSVVGATPTNAELATSTNWTQVYEDKAIGIVMLKHRVTPVVTANEAKIS
jgi:hypothetical protein